MIDELEREPTLKELLEEVHRNRFDIRKPVPKRPEYLLSISNNGDESGVALAGSIVVFSGMSKTRKSTGMAMFVAATLNMNGVYNNIVSKIRQGTVLWFDTEQTEIEFHYFQRMIYRMAGGDTLNPDIKYLAFNIRRYSEEQRFAIVNGFIKHYQNLALVVIDGIADLTPSVNDMTETKRLVTRMSWWCDTYKIPLFTTIHTNKDGKEATGSLGGFLDKKCSYHIRMSKDDYNAPTKVTPKHSRGGEGFKPFEFEHNGEGIPVTLRDYSYIGIASDEEVTPDSADEVPF